MHEEGIDYFKTQFGTKSTAESKTKLLNQVLIYLLRDRSMSPEQLDEWCQLLADTAKNYRESATYDTIIFAFQTLILNKLNDKKFTQKIGSMNRDLMTSVQPNHLLPQWTQETPKKISYIVDLLSNYLSPVKNYEQEHYTQKINLLPEWTQGIADTISYITSLLPNYLSPVKNREEEHSTKKYYFLPEWTQELHDPKSGLSLSFRIWDQNNFASHIGNEARLSPLGLAIENKDSEYITKGLNKIIEEIFTNEPKGDLSSQTRIVAIAALFHLLHTNLKHIHIQVNDLIQSLILNKGNKFFLFDHEFQLLKSLRECWQPCYPDVHNFNVQLGSSESSDMPLLSSV